MKEVAIYTTPTCHYCELAKEFFKKHNVAYKEYNVLSDVDRRKEMIELSGQLGVPVIHIGDSVLVGFQEKIVSDLLLSN